MPTPSDPGGCRARTIEVDGWLGSLFEETCPEPGGIALVAVGSYGRYELCPFSDLDLLLLHAGHAGIAGIADRLWYPIWDANRGLDHSVRSVGESLAVAAKDMKAALGLLDARLVAGDAELYRQLADRSRRLWEDRAGALLPELHRSLLERHDRWGEVAFLLEPELKEGRGGLRDVNVLRAAGVARPGLGPLPDEVVEARHVLLAIRAGLHQRARRPLDCLLLQEQDGVAEDLGFADADDLMAAVAGAARAVSRHSDSMWRRATLLPAARNPRRRRPPRQLLPGAVYFDGEVALTPSGRSGLDATLALRVASAAAELHAPLAPETLGDLSSVAPPSGVWPLETRDALVSLLGWGHGAIPVIESLDQVGLFVKLLPEWAHVRNRPQRNAYHRYTVDRHLLETAAQAAALSRDVNRPDLLLLAALFHDIGKGVPGRDHSEAGEELTSAITSRMGLPESDRGVVLTLVHHHLLLSQTATRRDIDDPATVATMAEAVHNVSILELLAALSQADGLATGPLAWTAWKASLVAALVVRVRRQLEGRATVEASGFPGIEDRQLMARGATVVRPGPVTTVVAPDQAGLLARIAGALAGLGLEVRTARAATIDGMAIEEFEIAPALGDWPRSDLIETQIRAAIAGTLEVGALLARRRGTYHPRRRAAHVAPPRVVFDRSGLSGIEVVEVRCVDRAGILGDLARALNDLGLDVAQARASTLGHEVVDAFYIRPLDGHALTDADRLSISAALVAMAETEAP